MLTGTEDRQHAYVALTRGTDVNTAYVFTLWPKRTYPAPGRRPAPGLARYDKIDAERSGDPASVTPPASVGTALGVLSVVLGSGVTRFDDLPGRPGVWSLLLISRSATAGATGRRS